VWACWRLIEKEEEISHGVQKERRNKLDFD
jgi:hypothetical protein